MTHRLVLPWIFDSLINKIKSEHTIDVGSEVNLLHIIQFQPL